MAINKATRAIIQSFSGGRELEAVPESCSFKVPGCPEWVPHLDRAREGTFQVVIALTDTKFLVWPRSQLQLIGRGHDTNGVYTLTKSDKDVLQKAGCAQLAVPASAGDVLIMLGGVCIHSSPEAQADGSERIATYAHWVPEGE